MDLSTIQPLLRDVVADLSGLQTVWEDEPRPMVDPITGAICLLSLPAVVELGWDDSEKQIQQNPQPGDDIRFAYHGNRLLTWTIKIESYDQTAGKTALARIHLLRTKLYWLSSLTRLWEKRIAIVRMEKSVDLSEIQDDRKVSIAVTDVILCVRFTIQDPTGYPSIEDVDIRGPWGDVPKP